MKSVVKKKYLFLSPSFDGGDVEFIPPPIFICENNRNKKIRLCTELKEELFSFSCHQFLRCIIFLINDNIL